MWRAGGGGVGWARRGAGGRGRRGAAAGRPITATSANVSGDAPTADPSEVERTLGDRIDLLIDTGPAPGGAPSTIVDATGTMPLLVRAGALAWDEIQAWLNTERNARGR